ncbi:MAG: restriction endonuclease subunit S [Candidatus Gracilibacteria bacterium]|nr:restriction endonuclease subunit S [Candidatus Gracilibacteria bacterium]
MYPRKKLSEILTILINGKSCKQISEPIGDKITRIETISQGYINSEKVGYFQLTPEDRKKYSINKGDILFSHINSIEHIGKIAIAEKDFSDLFHGMNLLLLRTDSNILEPKYLYIVLYDYYKRGYWKPICKKAINQASLNQGNLNDLPIPLPPLPTQTAIVAKLDAAFANIDKQIALLRGNIEDLKRVRESVLNESFSGDFPVKKLSEVCEKTQTWNPEILGESSFEYIDIASIDNKNYEIAELKEIAGNNAPSRAKKLVEFQDVLFATTRPNLKNIAVVNFTKQYLTCSTGFCVLRSRLNTLNYKYLFYFLISDILAIEIVPFIRGAGYPAISDKDLFSLQIPLPPLSTQQSIVAHLDSVFASTETLTKGYQAQITDLETMKQSLLQEAFEGRLVKE